MSDLSTQLTSSTGTSPGLRASAQRIAANLGDSTGAWACYLALAERAGQAPRLLATSGRFADLPSWRALEGAALLRRAFSKQKPLVVQAGEWPALALPLICDDRTIGAALLLYTAEITIDIDRALAAARLASSALDVIRQIAALHIQAEEIEERTRLREIQVSRNLIRGVIDSIPVGLALLDAEGTVLAVNRTLAERFGLEPVTLVGMVYSAALGAWHEFARRPDIRQRRPRPGTAHDRPDGRQTCAA